MQDLGGPRWGGKTSVWESDFEGRKEILLLGKALKFRVIFQKYELKIIESWKIIEFEKKAKFPEII